MEELNWYIYVLKSTKRDFIYTGSTNSLERRFYEHNQGLVHSTKAYRPLQLVTYIAVSSEQKARELERYFIAGSSSME